MFSLIGSSLCMFLLIESCLCMFLLLDHWNDGVARMVESSTYHQNTGDLHSPSRWRRSSLDTQIAEISTHHPYLRLCGRELRMLSQIMLQMRRSRPCLFMLPLQWSQQRAPMVEFQVMEGDRSTQSARTKMLCVLSLPPHAIYRQMRRHRACLVCAE